MARRSTILALVAAFLLAGGLHAQRPRRWSESFLMDLRKKHDKPAPEVTSVPASVAVTRAAPRTSEVKVTVEVEEEVEVENPGPQWHAPPAEWLEEARRAENEPLPRDLRSQVEVLLGGRKQRVRDSSVTSQWDPRTRRSQVSSRRDPGGGGVTTREGIWIGTADQWRKKLREGYRMAPHGIDVRQGLSPYSGQGYDHRDRAAYRRLNRRRVR